MACSVKPSLENQALVNLNNNLAQLTHWSLKGKIAWITETERKSAYMNWQQRDKNMQFSLRNVLGINLASLSYNGSRATLLADGQKYTNSSPSALVQQTTGWQVPLQSLSYWIKGAVSDTGRVRDNTVNTQKITRYDNGLIQQIQPLCDNCDQWTIDYTGYTNIVINNREYQLPEQISMYNSANKATIKIKISEWSQ
jgi:outer membrane lipoprotein LolB